jgi:hypothetical protein
MIELYAIAHFVCAIAVTGAAEQRDRFTLGWFLLALFLTPWFAILLLIACGDGKAKAARDHKALAEAIRLAMSSKQ